MEVQLDRRYPIAAQVEQAWAVLSDIHGVAACMPGAQITEQIDDNRYKGKMKIKVGPASAAFGGVIEVLAIDTASHQMKMLGKGSDKTGSTASMELTATIEAGDTSSDCVLVGSCEVIVNGKFAQFGGRLMEQVSDIMLTKFAHNFGAAAAAVPGSKSVAAEPDEVSATTAANAQTSTPASQTPVPAPETASELDAGGLVWTLIKNWFAGLFGRKS